MIDTLNRNVLFGLAALVLCGAAPAHEASIPGHTHAFEQTGYGTWRQGHSVNGPNGSITIWSPRIHTGYRNAPRVRFARPEPIGRAPAGPIARPGAGPKPAATSSNAPYSSGPLPLRSAPGQ